MHKWICDRQLSKAGLVSLFLLPHLVGCSLGTIRAHTIDSSELIPRIQGFVTAKSSLKGGQINSGKEAEKVRNLEAELRRSQKTIAELREKNLILSGTAPTECVEENEVATTKAFDLESTRKFAELPILDPSQLDLNRRNPSAEAKVMMTSLSPDEMQAEHYLYSKVIETYRNRNRDLLAKSVGLLLKAFPRSVYADNALYLAANSYLQSRQYDKALSFLNKITSDHPTGNKVVSAIFLKGIVLKKKKESTLARAQFKKVIESFPGSVEAKRATLEMRLIGKQAKAGTKL